MENLKTFNIRMPKETWVFLKQKAIEQESSMAGIILKCVEKYKRKCEKKIDGE